MEDASVVKELAAAAVLPAVIAFGVIAMLLRSRLAARLVDRPNERSLHVDPTPRVGGLGVAAGVFPFALLLRSSDLAVPLACAALLLAISLADDVRGLPIEVRLPAHACAALVAVLALASPATPWPWGWLGAAFGVLGLVWSTNLYNFMDGADGLAGGMGLIGFGAMAWAANDAGHESLAILSAAIASACAGFLPHNAPSARAFLGDCGAFPECFLDGVLGLHGTVTGAWPAWFPLLAFSPFIVDATVTLALRIVRGERFWVAHRSHGYQRLVLAGWSRQRVALLAWMLMLAASASALVARASDERERCAILFVWLVAYALLVSVVGRLTRKTS